MIFRQTSRPRFSNSPMTRTISLGRVRNLVQQRHHRPSASQPNCSSPFWRKRGSTLPQGQWNPSSMERIQESSSRSSTVENDSAFPSCLIRRLACLLPISKSMPVKRASSLHTIPTFTQATSGSPSFPRLTTNLAGPHIQTCSIWWTRRNTNWNWTCANRRRP